MRFRLIVAVLAFAVVTTARAQWTNTTNPTLAGQAAIGAPHHSSTRLRLADDVPGAVTSGPFLLTFGPSTAQYWAFRLDPNWDLHLDRQGAGGWTEGFVFNRDGNFGIGAVEPAELVHAERDHNAPTILRLSNASNGGSAYTALRLTEGSTLKAEIKSFSSGAASPNAMDITNFANGSMVFKTNNAERMRIHAGGDVTVGGVEDLGRLTAISNSAAFPALYALTERNLEANASLADFGARITTRTNIPVGVTHNGGLRSIFVEGYNLGPGLLGSTVGGTFAVGNSGTLGGTVNTAMGLQVAVAKASGTVNTGYGVYVASVQAVNDYAFYQYDADDTNYLAGQLVIGGPPTVASPYALAVQGNANFVGTVTGTNIKAHYQDLAEWVPATTDLSPGTVVILNSSRNNEVMASATSYDTTVAGVVSAQPGISLGIEGDGKEQIATTGRVKVRVDASTRPIRIGDLLVTSDLPGAAMRSEPMDINGYRFHRPGTIIGKALEPLETGVGEILVLLSMQ